jgi:DNA repair protein RadC
VVEPSDDDKVITRQLERAGEILGIRLLDHLIINKKLDLFSFQEQGLLKT